MELEVQDIKRIRKKHGLSQVQLAKLSGVSQSLIAKIESGKLDPSYSNAKRIFEALSGLSEKEELKAADIMIKKIIYAKPDETVGSVVKKLKSHQISQLPVISKNRVVGLVSESDIINVIAKGENIEKLKAADVMEDAPPVVSGKTRITTLLDLLKISQMVIVAESGTYKGVVTKADLLAKLAHV